LACLLCGGQCARANGIVLGIDFFGQLEEKNGLYYLNFLQEKDNYLRTLKRKETVKLLDKDFSNIKAAWDWAIKEARAVELTNTLDPVTNYFMMVR
jgi:hypothetical protein